MTQRWALVVLLALTACQSSTQASRQACYSIDDCGDNQTCFYGRCVDVGFGLTTVYAELNPPNDSRWLEQQVPYPLELADGFQDIRLLSSAPLTGRIRANDGTLLTGVLRIRPVSPAIPGRDLGRQTQVASHGFEVELLPGDKRITFEPGDDDKPPTQYWVSMGQESRDLELSYPEANKLRTFTGVVWQTNSLNTQAEGVRVVGHGTNPEQPGASLRSTTAVTDAEGEFSITFLPQIQELYVTVAPNPGINDGVPEVTFGPFDATSSTELGTLVLGIEPQKETVTVVIVDELGNRVGDANVLFEGSVGTQAGRFVVSDKSSDSGTVSALLLPGTYQVTVVPPRAEPHALATEVATIPNGDLRITLRPKVRLAGCVVESDGRTPVPNADVTLRRLDVPLPRIFTTTTQANGCYEDLVDPAIPAEDAQLQPALYELTVQPQANTGLPYFRQLIQIGESSVLDHDIQLYEPALVYGKVSDLNGMPLANVILAFYSLELGQPDEPVLVGVVSTLDGIRAGEFVLPVPVPPEE